MGPYNYKEYKHFWYLKNRKRLLKKAQKRYEENKPYHLEYAKMWAKKNPERRMEIVHRYDISHRELHRKRQEKYRKKEGFLIKDAARAALTRAIKSGRILKSSICSNCGSNKRIQAHHHLGYEKEYHFNVIWLCSHCHAHAHHL